MTTKKIFEKTYIYNFVFANGRKTKFNRQQCNYNSFDKVAADVKHLLPQTTVHSRI